MKKKGEKKNKDINFGGVNFGSIEGNGHVRGNHQQYPWMPEWKHRSKISSSYDGPLPSYPPQAHPYGGGGYTPPYQHPLGLGPPMPHSYGRARKKVDVEETMKTAMLDLEKVAKGAKGDDDDEEEEEEEEDEEEEKKEEEEEKEEQKPPPKTEAKAKAKAKAKPKPKPVAAAAAADPYWDVAPPPPQHRYPPRHDGGYPVQGYPAHHEHGGGYGYEYGYGYGAPPPPPQKHMGMGRLVAGAAAVHEGHKVYRHYRHGDYGYGHHGKFKQGHQGKYSHYYGPQRGG